MKTYFSIVNRSNIRPANRLDADFFETKYTNFENKIAINSKAVFSDVCEESEARIDPTKNPKEYFKYIEIADINLLDGSFFSEQVLGQDAPSRARKLCSPEDLIVSTVRPNRNAVAIIPTSESGSYVCSTGFCVFHPKAKGGLKSEVIFIFLKTKLAKLQLTRRMRATMYPAVANVDILQIHVPQVSASLRKKISNEMSRVYLLRRQAAENFVEIDVIVDKFCNSIISGNTLNEYDIANTMKVLRRAEVIEDANRLDAEFYRRLFDYTNKILDSYRSAQPLGFFYNKIFTGKTPSKEDYREPDEECVPIIKVGSLTNRGINWSGVEYASLQFYDRNKIAKVLQNDILFTSSAHSSDHIGKKVDVVNGMPDSFLGKCLFVGELMVLRNDKAVKIEPYYVSAFLRAEFGRIQVQRCSRGISSHIYDKDIRRFVRIPIPQSSLIDHVSALALEAERKKNKAIDIVKSLVDEFEGESGVE